MSDPLHRPIPNRFHGRVGDGQQACAHAGCGAVGEFRAPDSYGARSNFDGPGSYRWLCFDHVRAFNAAYNFFDGMSREEIEAAQTPFAGWERETRAFAQGGADSPPNWQNFADPLDAISARFKAKMPKERDDGKSLSPADHEALKVLGLPKDLTRKQLRTRYSELVRRYHPDRNGGDRSFEKKLGSVIAAYNHLRVAAAFL